MVSGESHYFQGRRYLLDVVERNGGPPVRLRGNRTLELAARPGASAGERKATLERWYRRVLRPEIAVLIEKWQPVIGVEVDHWGIKKMKTRWGTCNTEARRIWLNLELAKKPPQCLEYIVVHELVHLLERHHNDHFRALMDEFLPPWRLHRAELNRAPLAHENWSY